MGDKYFYFFYDESGVCGFRYKNIDFEYVKNIFGDVIGIYNEYGTHVATYAYDAWGNMIYCNAGTDVAYINPFLYRGYYYDSESGLYYLMTRYYDTQIGRFINPDTPDYLAPDTVGGVDLYSYCNNNPVKMSQEPLNSTNGVKQTFTNSQTNQSTNSSGLELSKVGVSYFASAYEYITAVPIAFLAGVAKNSGKYGTYESLNKLAGKANRFGSWVGIGALLIEAGCNIYDSCQSGEDPLRAHTDAAVDIAIGLGAMVTTSILTDMAVCMLTGALAGSAFPIVGNLVGLGVGIGVGIGLFILTPMIDDLKDNVYYHVKSLLELFS